MKRILFFAVFLLLVVVHGGSASALTNDYRFSTDFSSTQGQNQWYYKQWDGSSYSDMGWDAANNRWQGSCTYCIIDRQWMHPDGNISYDTTSWLPKITYQ